MRIAMDTREVEAAHPTGKGLWARKVLEEMRTRGIELTEFREATSVQHSAFSSLRWHAHTAKVVKKSDCNLYLSPTSYIVPWLLGPTFPHAIVVHDLIAFGNEPHDRKAKLIERLTLKKALKTAKHIFCVSEATKSELIERFPRVDKSKITVIYEGPTMTPNSPNSPNSLHILSVGTLCPRKNQLRLIQAFNDLPDDLRKSTKLILAGGRGWDDDEIVKLAEKSEGVEWKGYVPEEELQSLMTNAAALALPSLLEGFGLPVLDAMTLGTPVLTSNRSSLREVAGNAALLVDPQSIEEITNGLERLITDENLRNDLRSKGLERAKQFSWKKTVDLILEALA